MKTDDALNQEGNCHSFRSLYKESENSIKIPNLNIHMLLILTKELIANRINLSTGCIRRLIANSFNLSTGFIRRLNLKKGRV